MAPSSMLRLAVLLTLSSTAAMAADPVPEYVEPIVTPPFVWSGAYIGAHAGWGWGSVDGTFDVSELDEGFEDGSETTFLDDMDPDGFIGGLHVGYNFQRGRFVFGPEADITFSDIGGEVADNGGDDISLADVDLLASLRLRGGVAVDRALVYATGGVAYARGSFGTIDNRGEASENRGSTDFDAFGAVVGAGIEYAIVDNVRLRLEGLHYFFDEKVDTSNHTIDSDPDDFSELGGVTTVRVGLSVGF